LNRDVCGVEVAIYMKNREEIGFLEFFQKLPTRRHMHQTQFLGISDKPLAAEDEPPGSTDTIHCFWSFLGFLGYM